MTADEFKHAFLETWKELTEGAEARDRATTAMAKQCHLDDVHVRR